MLCPARPRRRTTAYPSARGRKIVGTSQGVAKVNARCGAGRNHAARGPADNKVAASDMEPFPWITRDRASDGFPRVNEPEDAGSGSSVGVNSCLCGWADRENYTEIDGGRRAAFITVERRIQVDRPSRCQWGPEGSKQQCQSRRPSVGHAAGARRTRSRGAHLVVGTPAD